MTKKQKARLVQNAIILAAVPGALRDIPTKKALAHLKSEVLKAIWRNGRTMRALEIVLAVVNDPTKTDSLASIVYKRLADPRRLLNTNPNRLHFAIHTFESMEKDGDKKTIFQKKQDPIAGMKQAAIPSAANLTLTRTAL